MTDSKTDYEAIIVGAGISGIVSACRLQLDLGLHNFQIFEKSDSWGGTWHLNQYPGCGCDIPTKLYSLSFAQKTNWQNFFSSQEEIKDYLINVANKHDLPRRAHFQHEVQSATFEEEQAHWVVHTKDLKTGKVQRCTGRLLFSCVGALSVPRKCEIPGADKFEGKMFHSARWDHNVDVTNKKVVVIGNGCTASQVVPNIAEKVKNVTQVVRAKHWMVPQLRNPFKGLELFERNIPGFNSFERMLIVLLCESHFLQTFKEDGKAARERFARVSRDYVRRCAPKEYHDLLIPNPGEVEVSCKRRIFDDGYIVCLGRPNVELTNDQAVEIVTDGILLQSGRKVDADVIVMANGFQTDQFALQMEICNGKGQKLEDYWKKEKGAPQAYRSELCSGFPNMFIIWGPNSITGHFSAIWAQERAVEMAMRVIRPLFLTGNPNQSALQRSHGKSIRVKSAAEEAEQEHIQQLMKCLIFSTGCGSWYSDEKTGRVTAVNPSFQITVAFRSRFPFFNDYEYRGVTATEAWRSWSLVTRVGSILRLGATPSVRGNFDQISFPGRLSQLNYHLWSRIAILLLQGFSRIIDYFFTYKRPEPYRPIS